MTDTERKALAERLKQRADTYQWDSTTFYATDADLMRQAARAIEQHEAFRQEVSDAVVEFRNEWLQATPSRQWFQAKFTRFIIAKPDPLVEALDEALWEVSNVKLTDRELRAVSLRLNAKRGDKIEGEG